MADAPPPALDLHAPKCSALLLDVDGTLAPIVLDPADASVPVEVRRLLIDIARRYALVACVSGRTAEDAKRVVGVAAITYIGCHGTELLEPGMTSAATDPQLGLWSEPVNELAIEAMRELSPIGVRREEKGAIAALHWRGAADELEAKAGLDRIASVAQARGLAVHWGRMVLEIRPPVDFDKGRAIEELIASRLENGASIDSVIYIGDDRTDVDAFAALDRLANAGTAKQCVRVGVASSESPLELLEAADVVVEGTDGVAALLQGLVHGGNA